MMMSTYRSGAVANPATLSRHHVTCSAVHPSSRCYFRLPAASVRFRSATGVGRRHWCLSPQQQVLRRTSDRSQVGDDYPGNESSSSPRNKHKAFPREVLWKVSRFDRLMNELCNELAEAAAADPGKEDWSRDYGWNYNPRARYGEWRLSADVMENKETYQVKVDVPGMTKDDIKLKVTEDRCLVLTAERKFDFESEGEESNGKHRSSERHYGRFSRMFRLPRTVDIDSISAEVKDGVLTVNLPKITQGKNEQERDITIG